MKEAPDPSVTYTCIIDTPLGPATVSAEDVALTGLWFIGQKHYPAEKNDWIYEPGYPVFEKLRAWLFDYFLGIAKAPNLRLKPQGTAFQKAVWNVLLKIPFGQVTTYSEIAKVMATARGLPTMSAQAVGGAIGHNPIPILIPCHRVVGADRSLTGYAGGLDKKRALLEVEHINLDKVKFFQLA